MPLASITANWLAGWGVPDDSGGSPGAGILGNARPPLVAPKRPPFRVRRADVFAVVVTATPRVRVKTSHAAAVNVEGMGDVDRVRVRSPMALTVSAADVRHVRRDEQTSIRMRAEDEDLLTFATDLLLE